MSKGQTYLAVIACGSNLNDPLIQLETARRKMSGVRGTKLLKTSPFYRTQAVGFSDQPDFLNGIFLVETTLDPESLFKELLRLEYEQGRERSFRNAPRTLDLDLIFYGDLVFETPQLEIPHPRMQEREFVLKPLCDVAPNYNHPVLQKTVRQLLQDLVAVAVL